MWELPTRCRTGRSLWAVTARSLRALTGKSSGWLGQGDAAELRLIQTVDGTGRGLADRRGLDDFTHEMEQDEVHFLHPGRRARRHEEREIGVARGISATTTADENRGGADRL